VKDILLLDVTPLTLSIETLGGVATQLIQRNTTIPTRSRRCSARRRTDRPASKCTCSRASARWRRQQALGRFHLDASRRSRGVPQIEVTFDIDANGIVHVAAKDRATGKENKITITSNSGLRGGHRQGGEGSAGPRGRGQAAAEEIESATRDNLAYATEKSLKDWATDCIRRSARWRRDASTDRVRRADPKSAHLKRLMQASHKSFRDFSVA